MDKYKKAVNRLDKHIETLERLQKQMHAAKTDSSRERLQVKCDSEVEKCSELMEWIDASLKDMNNNGINPEHENFDIKWSDSHVSIFW